MEHETERARRLNVARTVLVPLLESPIGLFRTGVADADTVITVINTRLPSQEQQIGNEEAMNALQALHDEGILELRGADSSSATVHRVASSAPMQRN